jgi:protein associated with RNAse G/E
MVIYIDRKSEVMNNLNRGEKLNIHSYKHDGNIHRTWSEAVFLDKIDNMYIFGNNKTQVMESDGRTWKTKEGAIIYFFENNWFNIVGQLKKDGIYYYCNIATPFIIDNKTIKYIDYDLDLRVFPDGSFKILDRHEYQYHKNKMHYSNETDKVIKYELNKLIDMVREKIGPFEESVINKYYSIYKEQTIKK